MPSSEAKSSGAPAWELWREDDNGNRDLIATFYARAEAERALARFESLGHKQTYWLEEAQPPRAGG